MGYNWRAMTPAQRVEVLRVRQRSGCPWHGPPHGLERHWYHLSAACFEHQPIVGLIPERMAGFEHDLLAKLGHVCEQVCVWCVLPTHYHVLVQCRSLPRCRQALGRLHGRCSHQWNVAAGATGRTCWHRCLCRTVKSENHRWATVNYIHHNPVCHGYVQRWQEWPFSRAAGYLEELGRDEAERIWREFPILEMGADWDREDPSRASVAARHENREELDQKTVPGAEAPGRLPAEAGTPTPRGAG